MESGAAVTAFSPDAELADLCVALYGQIGAPPVQWDHLDPGEDDNVCWALKKTDTADIIVLRGSVTVADWIHDVEAEPTMIQRYEDLGPVHSGFAAGMPKMWNEAIPLLHHDRPTWITGHSLGAARAAILAGMMLIDGLAPGAAVRFGEPRPGFAPLAALLARRGVYQKAYRNAGTWGHDYVTDVPLVLPEFPYAHGCPLTDIDAPPSGDLMLRYGLFAGHHMPLYAAALSAAGAQRAA